MTLRNLILIAAALLLVGGGPALGQPACGRAEYDQYLQQVINLTTAHNRTLKAAIILTKETTEAIRAMINEGCVREPALSGATCKKLAAESALGDEAIKANAAEQAAALSALRTFGFRQRFVSASGKVCIVCKHGYRRGESHFDCDP